MKYLFKPLFRDLKISIRNLFQFFKVVWNYRWWDSGYSMDIFIKAIELQARYTKKYGITYAGDKDPIVAKMERAVKLWKDHIDNEIEEAETYYGVDTLDENTTEQQRQKVYDLSTKLEQDYWEEFWSILQDNEYGVKTWWD